MVFLIKYDEDNRALAAQESTRPIVLQKRQWVWYTTSISWYLVAWYWLCFRIGIWTTSGFPLPLLKGNNPSGVSPDIDVLAIIVDGLVFFMSSVIWHRFVVMNSFYQKQSVTFYLKINFFILIGAVIVGSFATVVLWLYFVSILGLLFVLARIFDPERKKRVFVPERKTNHDKGEYKTFQISLGFAIYLVFLTSIFCATVLYIVRPR